MFDGKCSCSSQQLAVYLSLPQLNRGTVFPQRNFIVLQTSPFLPNSNISNPAAVLSWNEKFFNSVSNDTNAKSSKLPNKLHNQKHGFSNSSHCPHSWKEIFGQKISNFAPWCNSTSLASSKLLKKNYRDHFKTSKWKKSHGSPETGNGTELSELLPSPKGALKCACLFRKKIC